MCLDRYEEARPGVGADYKIVSEPIEPQIYAMSRATVDETLCRRYRPDRAARPCLFFGVIVALIVVPASR